MSEISLRNLIIVGDSAFAEIAAEYFEVDSNFKVIAFAVEAEFRKKETLMGRPVIDLERVEDFYPPDSTNYFTAITYGTMNKLRQRLSKKMKALGYRPARYVSSRAFVAESAHLDPHCFIMEGNVIQPQARIGEGTVLWSGNHIGHHSVIADYCFFSSHVVISGFCEIGARCFLGVNATLANNLVIGEGCWIGPGTLVTRNLPDDTALRRRAETVMQRKASQLFG